MFYLNQFVNTLKYDNCKLKNINIFIDLNLLGIL